MTNDFALGQLRHLYAQMLSGHVKDTAEAARGLLGPSIERLESAARVSDGEVDEAWNAAIEAAAKEADAFPDWIVGKDIGRRIRALKREAK